MTCRLSPPTCASNKGTPLHDTRHTSPNTRLTKTRHDQKSVLLNRQSENREELGHGTLSAICILNQVDCDSPPGQNGAGDEEVSSGLDGVSNRWLGEGEEGAGEGGENTAEDEISCGDGDSAPQVVNARGTDQAASSGKWVYCCGLGWCQHPVWLESGWEGRGGEVRGEGSTYYK